MPPKKGKGGGGKGKGKKPNPKYAGMEFDYELIGNKTRDEMEVITVNIQSDLMELRRDRIMVQMQRDYMSDLIVTYLQKIRDTRDLPKLARAQRNAMVDETEYIKGGMTDKMISNLDFAVSVNSAASNIRQMKKQKRIKKHIADIWRNIVEEMDELERLARNRPLERQTKISELEAELDNMNHYYDQAKEKQNQFVKTITKGLKKLYSDLARVDFIDIDWVELHYNQLIYEFLNMMSWRYFLFKHTAVENVHNILTGIMLMMEHWEQLEEDCRFMIANLELYAMDTEGLVVKHEAMKLPYQRTKISHVQLDRLRRGLRTSYRAIRESEEELQAAHDRYSQALSNFAPVEEELNNFKAKLPFLTEDLWQTYQERFKINDNEKKASEAEERYDDVRGKHQSFYRSPQEADAQFYNARAQVQRTDNLVEREKLRSLRILKQHDDMARSVRASVRTIGLRGWRVRFPPRPELIGRRRDMGDAPAGLVAKKSFPMWGTVLPEICPKCPPPDVDCTFEDD